MTMSVDGGVTAVPRPTTKARPAVARTAHAAIAARARGLRRAGGGGSAGRSRSAARRRAPRGAAAARAAGRAPAARIARPGGRRGAAGRSRSGGSPSRAPGGGGGRPAGRARALAIADRVRERLDRLLGLGDRAVQAPLLRGIGEAPFALEVGEAVAQLLQRPLVGGRRVEPASQPLDARVEVLAEVHDGARAQAEGQLGVVVDAERDDRLAVLERALPVDLAARARASAVARQDEQRPRASA